MKRIHQKKIYVLILTAFLLLNLCFMLYWCNQKQGWFLDEGFSFQQSNVIAIHMPPKEDFCIKDDKFFDKLLNVNQAHKFDFVELQQSLVAHPPLFYFIFHTVGLTIPDVPAKWRGLILNLLLFLLTQIALYKFSRRFLSEKQAFLPLILYGFSVPAICTVTFIRGYMLFTLLTTLLCLLAVDILLAQKNKEQKQLKISLFGFFAVLFLGCITHYYFFITAFVLCAGVCFILLIRKAYKILAAFSVGSLLSVAILPFLFPVMIVHLFLFERGFNQSILPMLDKNINNKEFSLTTWNSFINTDFFNDVFPYGYNWSLWVFIGLLVWGFFCWWRKKTNQEVILLCVVASLSVLFISAVDPLHVKRYFFHLMPMILLLVVLFFCTIFQKFKKAEFIAPLCLIILICGINLRAPNFQHYLYDKNTMEGQLSQTLQGKTLYVKWINDINRWKMIVPALYAPSADSVIFFDNDNMECYQDLISNPKAMQSAILTGANIDGIGCEEFAGWTLFFNDNFACFYQPKEEGEINE